MTCREAPDITCCPASSLLLQLPMTLHLPVSMTPCSTFRSCSARRAPEPRPAQRRGCLVWVQGRTARLPEVSTQVRSTLEGDSTAGLRKDHTRVPAGHPARGARAEPRLGHLPSGLALHTPRPCTVTLRSQAAAVRAPHPREPLEPLASGGCTPLPLASTVTFKPSRMGALSFKSSGGRVTVGSSGCSSATGLPGAPSATTSGSTSF